MLELAAYFALLSLVAVGGIAPVMPEMQRVVVEAKGWMEAEEFTQLFAVSQAAPGPNVLITSLIGWKVAGIAGALLALAAFCLPAAVLAWGVGSLWDRFRDAPWRKVTQRALVPVTVGLILAGGYVLATPAGLDWKNALIAGASAAALYFTKLNPLWILAGGAIAGAVLYS